MYLPSKFFETHLKKKNTTLPSPYTDMDMM